MQPQAEKLKVKFGSAPGHYDNRIITIPGLKGATTRRSARKTARITSRRVWRKCSTTCSGRSAAAGYERKLIGGIVLTGGGALMAHSDKLAEFHTGMSSRIGVPVENLAHGYHESVNSPIYSTAIGLLLRGLQDVEAGVVIPAQAVSDGDRETSNVSEEKEASWLERFPQNEGVVRSRARHGLRAKK